MNELDTIKDFVEYLDKKAQLVRSGCLRQAKGEENLLAYYAVRINRDGDHDFISEDDPTPTIHKPLEIGSLVYSYLMHDPRYAAKTKADEVSYVWDRLITNFTNHMIEGTLVNVDQEECALEKSELGVRYMALEHRFSRRGHGEAVSKALEIGRTKDKFVRTMMVPGEKRYNETAFFIMTYRCFVSSIKGGGYEIYRLARANFAQIYAKALLERHSHLKRVIGIACEPPGQDHGGSEDLVYAEQHQWTDEERREIRQECERLSILQRDMKSQPWTGQEYPEVESRVIVAGADWDVTPRMNRQRRRAEAAKQRKSRKQENKL